MEIILASASPRRKELLKKILKDFKVIPTDIDENIVFNQSEPSQIAKVLALKKAEIIARKHPKALVIGADTIVEKDGIIYGKPKDNDEAIKILKELRGTIQKVMTGIAIVCELKNIRLIDSEVTRVKMKDDITNEEIENYVRSGEGKDKAGSYAVQEKGDKFIAWLKGDYYNVVGFPLKKLSELLQKAKDKWNLEIDLVYNKQK
jgi:septum formation protein